MCCVLHKAATGYSGYLYYTIIRCYCKLYISIYSILFFIFLEFFKTFISAESFREYYLLYFNLVFYIQNINLNEFKVTKRFALVFSVYCSLFEV